MKNVIKTFRLPEDIAKPLSILAKKTHRTETFYVIQALKKYIEQYNDYQIAKSRFEDPTDKIITDKEMRDDLDL
ncbi:hypothetical protein ACFL5N_01735 [bacterium]